MFEYRGPEDGRPLGLTYKAQGMKCLLYFGIASTRDDTSAPLSGRGELHAGARVLTLVAEKVYSKLHKRNKNV